MTHVTYRLTTKNRDQLQNPTLGNRVWAAFTFFTYILPARRYAGLGTSYARVFVCLSVCVCHKSVFCQNG